MGYQDREYYQDDRTPSGFQFGGDLSYTWRLVIVNAGLFLANFFVRSENAPPHEMGPITEFLSVHGDTLAKPYLWFQFLTYGFVHDVELPHIFWNMMSLVIFGGEIERTYGRREFIRFYLLSIFLGGVLWGARVYLASVFGWEGFGAKDDPSTALLLGASGGVTAVTLLFCLRYPFATIYLMLVLPVPAWVLGVIMILGDVVQGLQPARIHGAVAHDVHLAGALFAIGYFYYGWNLTRTLYFGWLSQAGSTLATIVKPRPKLRVYEADEDDENVYRELEAEADRILAKISHHGEGSLSREERQTLEKYSRLMRQKHR